MGAFTRKRPKFLLRLSQEIERRRLAEEALLTKERVYRELLARSKQQQDQLRGMARRILQVQEEERESISRDLHEEVAQELAGINLQLAGLRAHSLLNDRGLAHRIAHTQRLVAKSVRVVHAFALKLRPPLIEQIGLHSALESMLRNRPPRKHTRLTLRGHLDLGVLDSAASTVLYRTAQDALGNIVRGSGLRQITIWVRRTGSSVVMEVSDSGRSFDPERIRSLRSDRGLGLLCMRERVEMAGGVFELEEGAERGTSLRVTMPAEQAVRRAS